MKLMNQFGSRPGPDFHKSDMLVLTDLYTEIGETYELYASEYKIPIHPRFDSSILASLTEKNPNERGYNLLDRTMILKSIANNLLQFYEKEFYLQYRIKARTTPEDGQLHVGMVKSKFKTKTYFKEFNDYLSAVIWCLGTMRKLSIEKSK